MSFKQLKTSDISAVRHQILEQQHFKCAICGKPLTGSGDSTLDHQHRLKKSQPIGEDGAGLVRGVLCRDCNALEGRIWNNSTRYKQLKTVQERIEFLKSLILYYSKPKYDFIHPTEKPAQKILSKKNFNIVAKLYKQKFPKRKLLVYPKSKHLTDNLRKIFDMFEISYYNEDTNSTR